MPSVVKIKIERGRDLPPMDHSVATESSTDAYVEVRLENHQQRTATCRRNLNPEWNEEFHFDFIDDAVMQDEPLELKCFDQDLYSSELIGVTYIDLNPLIMRTTNDHLEKDLVIRGWFPLFDTARGMRGSLFVTVKLQFIGNENPFQDSSAGIQFFSASTLSSKCFFVQEYLGFVEELIIQDDQENSWQDYFKGNKTSNDNRLRALYSLSAEVRRKLGKKVYEHGGNAVLGYMFHLDTEGSSTIVARAYGTACRILKVDETAPRVEISRFLLAQIGKSDPGVRKFLRDDGRILLVTRENIEPLLPKVSRAASPLSGGAFSAESLILLKSSEEMIIATQIASGAALKTTERPVLTREVSRQHKGEQHLAVDWMINVNAENPSSTAAAVAAGLLQSEVQLLTLKKFPSYVQVKLGGLVLARSVKYLGQTEGNSDLDTRLEWWKELRDEIKAHAKVLCCRYVIGYSETCSIYGDICILNAIGTAAELKGLSQATSTLNIVLPSPQGWESAAVNIHSSPIRRSLAVSRDTSGTELSEPKTPLLVLMNVDDTIPVPRALSNSSRDKDNELGVSADYVSAVSSEYNIDSGNRGQMVEALVRSAVKKSRRRKACSATHVPYNHNTAPFAFMRLVPCLVCKRKWVPETILNTIELPSGISVKGRGRLLEAKVVRPRKAATGETDAVKVSEVLPFVEYDLQRQIILKLKVFGMNAVFGYNCQIEIGNDVVVATAICTAVYLNSLPAPSPLQIMRNYREQQQQPLRLQQEQEDRLLKMQREMEELKQFYKTTLHTQYMESLGISGGNNFIDFLHRKRSGSKVLDNVNQLPSPGLQPDAIKDELESGDSTRSTRSSSSSSSSSDSSSSDSMNDGDDSTSLASPSSSSSSETEEDEDGLTIDDAAIVETTEQVNFDSHKISSSRGRSQSASSKKSDLLENILEGNVDSSKKSRTKPSKLSSKEESNKGIAESSKITSLKRKKEKKSVYKDERTPYILEIDDETDADILSVLQDWIAPNGIEMVNIGKIPNKREVLTGVGRLVTVLKRGRLFEQRHGAAANNAYRSAISSASLNSILDRLFQEAYLKLCFTVKNMIPCQILNITHYLNVIEDGQVEIVISAMVHKTTPKTFRSANRRAVSFQESDCSDSQDLSWKGNSWTPPRADVSAEGNRAIAASPSLKDAKINVSRSQSFDIASGPTNVRTRGASLSSNESFPLTHGDASWTESTKTTDDEGSTIPFQSLAHKSSDAAKSSTRLETIAEATTYEEFSRLNALSLPKERSRNASAASVPRSRQESESSTLLPPSIKIGPIHSDSQKFVSPRKTTSVQHILLTPLAEVPGARVKRYLGPVQLHFIKDFWAMRGEGTLGSFFYLLLSEVNSAARTHVAALGGNALLCHRLVPQEAGGKVARSQGYTMFSISGDAVVLEFYVHEDSTQNENEPQNN